MELNREQIIKALKCCKSFRDGYMCVSCPYSKMLLADDESCTNRMSQDALSLIEELTEENESLNQACTNLIQTIGSVQADTVKKMQTEIEARCIKGGIYPAFVKSTIDQIVKEMLNEETH